MSRWHAYLNTGKKIIKEYDGRSPLSSWLKDFFRQHKQMGSQDRKIISQLVYSFYRLGHSASNLLTEDKLLYGLFICNSSSNELLANLKPGWNNNIHLSMKEKESLLLPEGFYWQPNTIFPWQDELSDDMDKNAFNLSHLRQPDLFLRIRPQQENSIINKLNEAGILFMRLTGNCIALPNATKIDQVLNIDKEVVIQDYNSQRVGDFFNFASGTSISLWDCCAGSGGKSIMAYDLHPDINLTVSDLRASIIRILIQRFQKAGINKYHSFVSDLTVSHRLLPVGQFEYIIADVPCSGSGTWSRTPEQLYFFEHKKIQYYSDLQRNIVSQVIPKLKDNGRLIYITCSVFAQENEIIVEFIKTNFGLQLEVMELLHGNEMKADSMFVAVFKKV
jgi:16S rRNA (cytosine967-C5)-methyltransferase